MEELISLQCERFELHTHFDDVHLGAKECSQSWFGSRLSSGSLAVQGDSSQSSLRKRSDCHGTWQASGVWDVKLF